MPMHSVAAAATATAMEIEWKWRKRMASDGDVRPKTIGLVVVVVLVVLMMMSVVVCVVDSSSIASTQDGGHLRSDIYHEDEHIIHVDCQADNGNCHSNQHCCHGYICSPGLDPESGSEAGICRRSNPNLSPCHSDDQCSHGSQCIYSDQTGQGFCQTAETEEEQRQKDWAQHMYHDRKGGLGSSCESSTDCKPFTLDGTDHLCCQDVRRGRQGTKRMCDRVTGISICIQ